MTIERGRWMLGAVAVVAASFSLATVEAGAAAAPKRGGTLVIAHDYGDPAEGLDPHTTIGWPSHLAFELMYTTLVRYNDRLVLEPDLATDWEVTPDSRVYTFDLRKGVKFHNGREMTAEDVKYSFERVLDPKTKAPYRTLYELIEKIEVLGPYRIRFTFKEPFAPFLDNVGLLRASAIVPKEAVEANNGLNRVAVGTGPFKLKEYVKDSHIILVRNPDYYEPGLPYLDQIEMRFTVDEARRLATIRSDRAHMTILGGDSVALLQGTKLQIVRSQNMAQTQLNLNSSRKPFDNVRVRQAVSLALDRQAIIDAALGGNGLLTGPIPTGYGKLAIPVEQLPYRKPDMGRAKALLKEAGYPDGLKVTLRTASGMPWKWDLVAPIVKDQLAAAGIDVTIEMSEWGSFLRRAFTEKDYEMRLITATFQEASQYIYDYFHSKSSRNRAEFRTGELDELAARTRVETNPGRREALFREVQQKVLDLSPVIYLYTGYEFFVMSPGVKGYRPIPNGSRTPLRETWLEQ